MIANTRQRIQKNNNKYNSHRNDNANISHKRRHSFLAVLAVLFSGVGGSLLVAAISPVINYQVEKFIEEKEQEYRQKELLEQASQKSLIPDLNDIYSESDDDYAEN